MPVRSDDPLKKVTMNFYASDVIWLEENYGHGWTERVRQHIHNEVIQRKAYPLPINRPSARTLGDLAND